MKVSVDLGLPWLIFSPELETPHCCQGQTSLRPLGGKKKRKEATR
jgi:hypothetical protein